MMHRDITREAFEKWLRNPVNYRQLETIAHITCRRMSDKNISLPGTENSADDICQELFTFILKKPAILKDLLQGGYNHLIRYNFWQHIIDKTRSSENNQDIYKNTWRLFRRQVLTVLSSSKLKKSKTPGKEISFGLTESETVIMILPEDLDHLGIDYPKDLPGHYEGVKKRKNILKLADHFWREIAARTDNPDFRVTVSTFVSWIGRYVELQVGIDSESDLSLPEENGKRGENSRLEYRKTGKIETGKTCDVIIPDYIKTWAENFYNRLQGIEKEVFFYYECKSLKGEAISKLMGRKASLSYQKNKVEERLKSFLIDLPWLSPPDLDKEAFNLFMDELCERLSLTITSNKKY